MKILILGGIKEASVLASKLVSEGHDVTTSLAGRTKEPAPVEGQTRIGGFGGASGLAAYLKEHSIELLIDCTHPFAKQISANAISASKLSGVKLQTHMRKPWEKQKGDTWVEAKDLAEARDKIPKNARVLLALGSQYIDQFKTRSDVFFLVRMVDQPDSNLPLPDHKLLIAKPSADWQDEKQVLEENNINHIVCRNSGGKGAYAKIEAAREMKIPVIIVNR